MPREKEPINTPKKPFFYLGDTTDENEPSPEPPLPLQNTLELETPNESRILTQEERKLKWKILQNVVAISIAFMLLFTGLTGVSNLQSSFNKKLNTTSLWTTYVCLVFSCAFVTTFVIRKLEVKWTVAVSMVGYSSYIAAHLYPTYYTLIPAAFILGLAAGPMWSAKCTYITLMGRKYGQLAGKKSDATITFFFGIFFLFFHCSRAISITISSTVMSIAAENASRSDEFLDTCGVNFCPSFAPNLTSTRMGGANSSYDLAAEERHNINVLTTIYLIISVISTFIIAFSVDSLSRFGDLENNKDANSGWRSILATFQHLKNPYQILIIPLTIWCGVEQAYLSADFPLAFVTCSLGVHMIGYVMIADSICDAVCSLGFTPLVNHVGRGPVFIFGASLNAFTILVMFLWKPNPGDVVIFFFIPALWGIADAIWQTQINAFYGVMFPKASEAAFSNYRLWETLGYILAYALSSYACVSAKLYVNIGFLCAGLSGYFVIEVLERRKRTE